MSDPTLEERREAAAAYWDQVARNHLNEADLANRTAYEWRHGDHDDQLTQSSQTPPTKTTPT